MRTDLVGACWPGLGSREEIRGTHSDNFEGTPRQVVVSDRAISAPLADLQVKRLPDKRLVVLPTEFGRTPRINDDDGRDHDDDAFKCLLAGVGD